MDSTGYLDQSPWMWRVTAHRDDDGETVVTVRMSSDMALAVARRDRFHKLEGAARAIRDLAWAVGEAVE